MTATILTACGRTCEVCGRAFTGADDERVMLVLETSVFDPDHLTRVENMMTADELAVEFDWNRQEVMHRQCYEDMWPITDEDGARRPPLSEWRKANEAWLQYLSDRIWAQGGGFIEGELDNDRGDAIDIARMRVASEMMLQAFLELAPQSLIDRVMKHYVTEDRFVPTLRDLLGVDEDIE